MPRLIETPSVIEAAGNKPKRIEEYFGRVNSGHEALSLARMKSPERLLHLGHRGLRRDLDAGVRLPGEIRGVGVEGYLDASQGHGGLPER